MSEMSLNKYIKHYIGLAAKLLLSVKPSRQYKKVNRENNFHKLETIAKDHPVF